MQKKSDVLQDVLRAAKAEGERRLAEARSEIDGLTAEKAKAERKFGVMNELLKKIRLEKEEADAMNAALRANQAGWKQAAGASGDKDTQIAELEEQVTP